MTPEEKVKLVTNYSEQSVDYPNLQISYLDAISSRDEEHIRLIKERNRNLAIDAIVDDKIEEWKSSKSDYYLTFELNSEDTESIYMKVFTMNIQSKKIKNYDTIWKDIISLLEFNSKLPKKSLNGNLDVKLSGNFEEDRRRVITKFVMSSNLISINGRFGPGLTAIVGHNCAQFIEEDIMSGFNIIIESNIDPDKIILIRNGRVDQPGIILIEDKLKGNYYLKETPNFLNQICWFWIK